MAKPTHLELTLALNLCRAPQCAGHPEQCDSCFRIAEALADARLKERRKARKKMKVDLLADLTAELGRYGRPDKRIKENPSGNAVLDIRMTGYWLGIIDGVNKVYRHVSGGEKFGEESLPWEEA